MLTESVASKARVLLDIMRETESDQEELLQLALQKRPAILGNKTEELNEIVSREYRLLSQMKNTEKRRAAVVSETAVEAGVPVEELTLFALAERLPETVAAELGAVRDSILKVADLLKTENAINGSLLETQLSYTGMMLDLFGSTEDPINNFYGSDGKSSGPEVKRNNIFDANV